MNENKWRTESEPGRLLDHLVDVLPWRLVMFVALDLAELAPSGSVRLQRAVEDVRAFLAGARESPTRAECDALESELERDDDDMGGRVAVDLIATIALASRHLRALGESLIDWLSLSSGDPRENEAAAKSLVAERLRARLPWIPTQQVRFEETNGRFETEDLCGETKQGRLACCERRRSST